MSLQKAAEELLRVADMIEKEAAEVTSFVCEKCNHTATLATINNRRHSDAKTAGENVTVSDITVNDKITCLACQGVMAYKETEASAPFYYNPEKKADDAEKCPPEKPAKPDEDDEDDDAADVAAAAKAKKDKKDDEDVAAKAKTASAPIDYDSLDRYITK